MRITLSLLALLAMAAPAQAGFIGVTNSWSHSSRTGTGSTVIESTGTSQLSETSSAWASKSERGRTSGELPGQGNGNGNGGNPPGLGARYEAESGSSLRRTFTETSNFTAKTQEKYNFSDSNFTHSVGAFAE